MQSRVIIPVIGLIGLIGLGGCKHTTPIYVTQEQDSFIVPAGTRIGQITTKERGQYFSDSCLEKIGIEILDRK